MRLLWRQNFGIPKLHFCKSNSSSISVQCWSFVFLRNFFCLALSGALFVAGNRLRKRLRSSRINARRMQGRKEQSPSRCQRQNKTFAFSPNDRPLFNITWQMWKEGEKPNFSPFLLSFLSQAGKKAANYTRGIGNLILAD